MAEKDFVDSAVDEIEARADAVVNAAKLGGEVSEETIKDVKDAVYAITGEVIDVPATTKDEVLEIVRKRVKDSAEMLRALKRIATG